MTMTEMLTAYNAHSPAHVYALGFRHDRNVYVVKLTFAELTAFVKLDRASSKRGGFAKLRVKLTARNRAELLPRAELLGAEELLTADPAHNRGENFERVLTERWTTESWVKDSVPFWQAGDLRVNGVEVQVKLDGAELTNERILAKLGA